MSLIVYRPKSIPDGLEVCEDPVKFFDEKGWIPDNEFAKEVLLRSEAVERISDSVYLGIGDEICHAMSKEYLLPSTKAVLCVLLFPDICFDLSVCWTEALDVLLLWSKGTIVYWHRPLGLSQETECDMLISNKYPCNTIGDFYKIIGKVY